MAAFGPQSGKPGPVHEDMGSLSRCGVRIQFRHRPRPDSEIDCAKCIRLAKTGERRAWKHR